MSRYTMSKAADEAGLDYDAVVAKALAINPGARVSVFLGDLVADNRDSEGTVTAAIEALTSEAVRAGSDMPVCEWGRGRRGWLVSSAAELEPGTHVWVVRRDGSQQDVWVTELVEEGRRGHLYDYREFDPKA